MQQSEQKKAKSFICGFKYYYLQGFAKHNEQTIRKRQKISRNNTVITSTCTLPIVTSSEAKSKKKKTRKEVRG